MGSPSLVETEYHASEMRSTTEMQHIAQKTSSSFAPTRHHLWPTC